MTRGIRAEINWNWNNILAYPLSDESQIEYHELVRWVAGKVGVDPWVSKTQPTFVVERAVQEAFFAGLWDKLTGKEREDLLTTIESQVGKDEAKASAIEDKAGIAALSGAGAIAALSTTVYLTGFAFYTTMSVAICTVAGWVGVTLPFAAYAGAASTVAFLSGPVGWLFAAVLIAAGVATIAGKASLEKTAAVVCQIHALKVAALEAKGDVDPKVFRALGDPVRRQLVGRWSWKASDRFIEFDLRHDGTFTATNKPSGDPGLTARETWLYKTDGTWDVRDGKLSVDRSEGLVESRWMGRVTELDGASIERIAATEVSLGKLGVLKRQ